MTKKVYELLGLGPLICREDQTDEQLPYPVHVGVEIEAEDVHNTAWLSTAAGLWRAVPDGSLRNDGVEFVFDGPQCPKDAVAALSLFSETGKGYSYGPRTSVHVHVNVRDISSPALLRFILLYVIFERVLYNRFGHNRYSNNFCVPAHVNEELLEFLSTIDRRRVVKQIVAREQRAGRREAGLKYGGINLSSLSRYGTVEFRFCAGTSDLRTLLLLVNVLCAMRQYAVRNTDLRRYIDEASDGNMSNLLYRVLPENVVAGLGTYAELQALCVDGARVVERVLHAHDLEAVAERILGSRVTSAVKPVEDGLLAAHARPIPTRPAGGRAMEFDAAIAEHVRRMRGGTRNE